MQNGIILVAIAAGVLAFVAVVVGFRTNATLKRNKVGTTIASLPALVMLTLFYSLVVHMRLSLEAWPTSIGEGGFPAPLAIHAHLATSNFAILILITFFIWPGIFLICFFVRRWRGFLFYLGVYVLTCLLSFGIMLLAPSQFLNWWWD